MLCLLLGGMIILGAWSCMSLSDGVWRKESILDGVCMRAVLSRIESS